MSNRRKRKDGHFSRRGWRPGREARLKNVRASGLARSLSDEGVTDEALEKMGFRLDAPEEDPVLIIKEVPAVVTHPETEEKVTVGTAYIHDDGSVAIKYDEDAPEWALKYIKHTADLVGYSLETGEPKRG